MTDISTLAKHRNQFKVIFS